MQQSSSEKSGIGTPEVRKQIGKELRNAREVQEMSLEQVVSSTRINTRNLMNIESGNWSFLPPTYVKAFILSYAAAIGLPLDKLHRQLDDLFRVEDSVERTIAAGNESTFRDAQVGSQSGVASWADQNRSLIFYGLITLASIVIVIFYISRPTDTPTYEPRVKQNVSEVDTVRTVRDTVDITLAAVAEREPAPIIPNTYQLIVVAEDTCYLKIERGDSLLYERTLWPGNRISFEPDGIVKVSLGNAPGIRLSVNGNDLPQFPPGRRVRIVRVDENGYVR